MAILSTSRAHRHYHSVTRLPKRETRVASAPAAEFGEGLIASETPGRSTPIDSRELPTILGAGLTEAEFRRVTGAENRARAAYAEACPEADFAECHRVGRLAATDELRRTLKDRPAAPELKAKSECKAERPEEVEAAAPARKSERFEPSAEDRAWWAQYTELAANGLAPVSGGAPEPECGVSGAWFLPGEDRTSDLDYFLDHLMPDPEVAISGEGRDFGHQYLSHEEGGAL